MQHLTLCLFDSYWRASRLVRWRVLGGCFRDISGVCRDIVGRFGEGIGRWLYEFGISLFLSRISITGRSLTGGPVIHLVYVPEFGERQGGRPYTGTV